MKTDLLKTYFEAARRAYLARARYLEAREFLRASLAGTRYQQYVGVLAEETRLVGEEYSIETLVADNETFPKFLAALKNLKMGGVSKWKR